MNDEAKIHILQPLYGPKAQMLKQKHENLEWKFISALSLQ